MRIRLHEPAVALTDLAIGLEAGLFAILLARSHPAVGTCADGRDLSIGPLRRWFVAFFAATSLAAIVGAVLQTPAGYLADRFGARTLLIGALVLSSAAYLVVGIAPAYLVLLAMFTVGGVATWLEPSSSIRNTLLVQRIIDTGSSITGMPSCQARRANR